MSNKLKIIVWKAKDGWRWHMKRSGRIVAESGEAYSSLKKLQNTVNHIGTAIATGEFGIEKEEI